MTLTDSIGSAAQTFSPFSVDLSKYEYTDTLTVECQISSPTTHPDYSIEAYGLFSNIYLEEDCKWENKCDGAFTSRRKPYNQPDLCTGLTCTDPEFNTQLSNCEAVTNLFGFDDVRCMTVHPDTLLPRGIVIFGAATKDYLANTDLSTLSPVPVFNDENTENVYPQEGNEALFKDEFDWKRLPQTAAGMPVNRFSI